MKGNLRSPRWRKEITSCSWHETFLEFHVSIDIATPVGKKLFVDLFQVAVDFSLVNALHASCTEIEAPAANSSRGASA